MLTTARQDTSPLDRDALVQPSTVVNAGASTAYSFGEHGAYSFKGYSRRTLRAINGSSIGIRYRKHVTNLPGTPDLANRRRMWAIFVHGCFWHCHEGCRRFVLPKTQTGYWIPKLRGNAERDAQNVAQLQAMGLRVFIIWECQANDPFELKSLLKCFFEQPHSHSILP